MSNDFKDRLKEESKNYMPDLWSEIEGKLEYKKKNNNKKIISIAASLAVVFIIATAGRNILINEGNFKASNSINQEVKKKNDEVAFDDKFTGIDVLPDLDLKEILEDKIVLSLSNENNYSADINSVDYSEISENIVYGKITEVKSYVKFEGEIYSDMTVEVIEDYKGGFKKGDTFIMGAHGGEMNYEDYVEQIDPMRVEKFGYDRVEDKSKMVIDLRDGVPMYREGEYVLVYVKSLDNEEYYKEHPELIENESYDYGVYKRLYVNPNTREVFKYEYKLNNTLEKLKAGTLDDIENIDLY
ncbi:Uncharacterised protein [uncultured Clostridium sp.]|uniref:hypothetical protein n=1 Tax=uncultured Clostridium sp. TaxID=59620 RepID=UPI00082150FD|nr:hypothetical protein [uncultured Clostridium sp.]SCJ59873.1 Uncharacterised protein [uncultured Clostridium sp.]